MFKRILIPLDGSERAERAIPVAVRAAHSVGGSILLLRVVNTAAEHYPSTPSKPALLQSNVMTEPRLAESYLGALAKSDHFLGLFVQTRVLSGLVAPSILSTASSEEADVIIMCSHGYSGITRWVLGSVAEKVALHANLPVLILRESSPIPTEQEPVNLRVCVPLDGSAFAEAALIPAATLASVLATSGNGNLHLTRIVQPGAAEMEEAKHYLESTRDKLLGGSFTPSITNFNLELTCSVVSDKDVAHAIIKVAEQGRGGTSVSSSVIALTTHGNGRQAHWATGSIAGRVLHATTLPLLIVRPTRLEEQRD